MKHFLISLLLLFSLNTSFAKNKSIDQVSFFSNKELNVLRNSIKRLLPEFKEFKRSINGEGSYSLFLSNACYKDIMVYVRYLNLDYEWVDAGFWKLSQNDETYVGETTNTYYYPGAYSTDETLSWGDLSIIFQGYHLFVSEKRIDRSGWGDWVHEFSCN